MLIALLSDTPLFTGYVCLWIVQAALLSQLLLSPFDGERQALLEV